MMQGTMSLKLVLQNEPLALDFSATLIDRIF